MVDDGGVVRNGEYREIEHGWLFFLWENGSRKCVVL